MALTNTEFSLSLVSSSLIITHFYVIQSVNAQLIIPYGFDDTELFTDLGLAYNLIGIIGSIITSVILYFYPEALYKACFTIGLGTLATYLYFVYSIEAQDTLQLDVANFLCGFATIPILMVAYELAVAQTLHLGIGEGMSCGLINSLANVLGFLYVFSLTFWLSENTKNAS